MPPDNARNRCKQSETAGEAVADTLFRWSLEDESGEELDGWIYFIVCPEPLSIKIGFTKKHPIKRLKQLQTGCPSRLVLRGWYPGSLEEERKLHESLSSYRLEGEWFRLEPEMGDLLQMPVRYMAVNNALTGWEEHFS